MSAATEVTEDLDRVLVELQDGERFLLTTHEGPDGDGPVIPARTRVVGTRDRGDELEGGRRVRGELEDVRGAQPPDELSRRSLHD